MIRAAVLGSDVSKSRSPAIHTAAFEALGLDGEYVARSVDAAGFVPLVQQLRKDGYRYLNVTIPHKEAAAQLADEQGPEVRASGAANTLLFPSPEAPVRGENTDGAGLIAALADLGAPVAGATIVMVGAGGAAAGAAEALTRAGARLRLVARRQEAADALRARLRAPVTVAAWTADELRAALTGADILVSAVPAAAWAPDDARAGLAALAPTTAVLEMAYGATTPLADAARARTERYADGLGMLVHQAAHAIMLALGTKPPLAPLFAAVRAA
ncbi:MAG TPA: NAD(P)-dependent oxidoreductase [Polyangia bacterium]|nr:NAD(P)-dependent oxidoreductase [Polyangia bacterium]